VSTSNVDPDLRVITLHVESGMGAGVLLYTIQQAVESAGDIKVHWGKNSSFAKEEDLRKELEKLRKEHDKLSLMYIRKVLDEMF
jgi:hypothetical protein